MAVAERVGAVKIERSELTDIVRKALGSRSAEPVEWDVELLGGGSGAVTRGVHRVSGSAVMDARTVPWTLIVKEAGLDVPGVQSFFEDKDHPLYWKREAIAYRSGLLDDLPGGIGAPRCYGVIEREDGRIRLWLEDVRDRYGEGWPLEQYSRAAACLGRFNGAYLAGRWMPDDLWLVRSGSPRGLLDHNAWVRDVLADPETWRHPLARTLVPVPVADRLLELWDEREALLRVLDRVPQTFCHLDAWRMNMAVSVHDGGGRELVLLDWAYPGRSAVGTDAGDLFGESFGLAELDDVEPADLDRAIFESYLDGLRAAGWTGDPRTVRLAFTSFCSLKHTFSVGLFWLRDLPDEGRHAIWEGIFKRPFEDFAHRQAKLVSYLLDMGLEARVLAGE